MTRKRKPAPLPTGLEIRVGYVHPFIVVNGTGDNLNVFGTLAAAEAAYPTALVTEGARRKAEELGQK